VLGEVLDTDRIGLVLLCGSCPEGVVRGGGAWSLLHGHLGRSLDLAQCLHTVVSASQACILLGRTYKGLLNVVTEAICRTPVALLDDLGLLFGL
jgi:hypothetical protein